MRVLGFLLLLAVAPFASAMACFDGHDCHLQSCSECEGVACVRIQRYSRKKGQTVALTCVPSETIADVALYPEGCRSTSALGERVCVCTRGDFCNAAPGRFFSLPLLSSLLLCSRLTVP